MGVRVSEQCRTLSAAELLGIGGFSFFIGWMLVSFYWLFCEFPPGLTIAERDLSQLFIFLGISVGYGLLTLLARRPSFTPFAASFVGAELVFSLALPLCAFALFQGIPISTTVASVINFLAGMAASGMVVSWLDVCSRLQAPLFGRFTGLSLTGGGLLFVLAAVAPDSMQPLFSTVYTLCSIGLLVFSSEQAPGNGECAPQEAIPDTWQFTREIEPSFFTFSIIFALTFVFLFNSGKDEVFWGLASIVPGALVIAIPSALGHEPGITTVQRILLVITVFACVATPFLDGTAQLICSCLVIATWALFRSVNFSYIVKKSVVSRMAPLYRQAPPRLAITSLGFACGWLMATIVTNTVGPHAPTFITLRLIMAVALVVVVMVFFPVRAHHLSNGQAEQESQRVSVVPVAMDAHKLFDLRCDAVARLYQLSPRESDILRFLAKGRNASWIQEELTISPHTVKSHIYNIYRKLDIHSQQKLMDFVESFPLDENDL